MHPRCFVARRRLSISSFTFTFRYAATLPFSLMLPYTPLLRLPLHVAAVFDSAAEILMRHAFMPCLRHFRYAIFDAF